MPIPGLNRPLGTVQELIQIGLSPAEYHACAQRKDGEIAGCPVRHLCTLDEKERTGPAPKDWNHEERNWEGPVNLGVDFRKPVFTRGVSGNQEPMPCYIYFQLRNQLRANGGLMKIVAREGETIKSRGSQKIGQDGKPIADGIDLPGKWRKTVREVKVPRHPRPNELEELEGQRFLSEDLKDAESESDDSHDRKLGPNRMIGASKDARGEGSNRSATQGG